MMALETWGMISLALVGLIIPRAVLMFLGLYILLGCTGATIVRITVLQLWGILSMCFAAIVFPRTILAVVGLYFLLGLGGTATIMVGLVAFVTDSLVIMLHT